jgi:hypothetical protein
MTLTILAAIFLGITIAVALLGFRAVITQGKSPSELNKEKCSICRSAFPKSELVERQVGDVRVLHFCHSCITSLNMEMQMKR